MHLTSTAPKCLRRSSFSSLLNTFGKCLITNVSEFEVVNVDAIVSKPDLRLCHIHTASIKLTFKCPYSYTEEMPPSLRHPPAI